MQAHEERVVVEAQQLSEKRKALAIFIFGGTDLYRQVPLMEKERMHLQHYLMGKYIEVLDDRIAYFKE